MQGRSARTTSNQISTINGPAIIIWFLIDETSLDVAFSRPCDAVRDAGTQRTRRMRWTGLLAVQRLNWIFPLTSTRAFPAWKPFANLFDCSLSSPATQPGSRTLFLLLFPAPLRVRGRARGLLRLIARLARSHPSRHPPPPSPMPSTPSALPCVPFEAALLFRVSCLSISLYFSNHFLCFLHRFPIRLKPVLMDAMLRHFSGLRRANRFASRGFPCEN